MINHRAQKISVTRLPLKLAVLCFAVLGASFVVNAIDRQVFSMLLPSVMKDYGFPLQSGGLLVSIFTLGIGLAGIPTGYLMGRLSRKAVMMIAIAIYSAFTIMTAHASGFTDMFLYRTATGLGEGMQIAALYAATGAYFPKQRAFMFALLSALFGLGNFIGPLVAGRLLETHDWRIPLIVFGLVGLVFVVMIAFVSTNFTEHYEGSSEKATRDDALPEGVWNRNLVVVIAAAVTFGFSQYAFLSMYPTFLGRMLHLPPSSIGFIMSMFGLGVIAAVPISYFGDRMRQKWIVLIALFGGAVLGYFAFNSGDATGLHHAILSFLVGLFGGTFIANTSSLMQRSVPAIHIAKASGIYVTSVYLPASFSGYVFGTLVNSLGWSNSALIQLTIVPALGAAVLLLMDDRNCAKNSGTVVREAIKTT